MEPKKAAIVPPDIGRICHFIRLDPATKTLESPQAAIITAVHDDRCINITVFRGDGRSNHYRSIALLQPGDVAPQTDHCRWMEYQIGQAQKTAELQAKLDREPEIPPPSAEEKSPALSG